MWNLHNRRRTNMNYVIVYTLRDGRKKSIKAKEAQTIQDELKALGITEYDVFQRQLVELEKSK